MRAVAVLLCSSAVTPTPTPNALSGSLSPRANQARNVAPNPRISPVVIMCVPHKSKTHATGYIQHCSSRGLDCPVSLP
jgi:hypothetical protein